MQNSSEQPHDNPVLAYVTCPDAAVAERIAAELVDRHAAACVNIVPGLRSVYRWQGQVETAQEQLLMIKTQAHRFATIQACLQRLHPDDVPEFIAMDIQGGSPAYLDWLIQQTR